MDIDGLMPQSLRQWADGIPVQGTDKIFAFQPENTALPHYRLFDLSEITDFISGSVYINVKTYGAQGNGTTDDTAAIQSALTAASGNTLFFPMGRYLVSGQLFVPSGTRLLGCGGTSSVLVSQVNAWTPARMLVNENWDATVNTDENITVESMAFDWSDYVGIQGAAHSIQFRLVTTVKILNCVFIKGGDATACLHCYDVLVQGCSSFDARNCAYDFWYGCKNCRVISCYAESVQIGQMINFNSTPAGIVGDAQVGDGFILDDCDLVCTDSAARAIFLTPLGGAGVNTVQNVQITNNRLDGVIVIGSGKIFNVIVANNTFSNTGTNSGIGIFTDGTSTPQGITCAMNIFKDAATSGANLGVIRLSVDDYIVLGNIITGSAYYAGIDVDTIKGVVGSNVGLPGTSGVFVVGSAWVSNYGGLRLANNEQFVQYTTTGARFKSIVQNDDNWRLVGTNSSDAERDILGFQNGSDVSTLRSGPDMEISVARANQFKIQGSAAGVLNGSSALIQMTGSDTDIAMRILGKGAKGVLIDSFDGVPSTTMIPNGLAAVVNNSGTITLSFNNGGTIMSVALT